MLDLLIFNEDRHRDNILLKPRPDGRFDLIAIDHEDAWMGSSLVLPIDRTPSLDKCPETLYEHQPLPQWLRAAAARAARINARTWHALANLTANLVPDTHHLALGDLLCTRAARLEEIANLVIREYRKTS